MYHEKLTQKDVERLQEEIDHRKLVVRKEAIEAVKEARAQGDLSENFESGENDQECGDHHGQFQG